MRCSFHLAEETSQSSRGLQPLPALGFSDAIVKPAAFFQKQNQIPAPGYPRMLPWDPPWGSEHLPGPVRGLGSLRLAQDPEAFGRRGFNYPGLP